LFQSRQILSDEAQGLLPLQSPTRWQIGAPLKVAANRFQIAQQTFAQPADPPQELEIQLLPLGFSPRFALEEMNLLAHAPKLFLLLQEPNLIHVRQIHSVQIATSATDPGDQSDQNARVRGSLGVGFHRGAVDEALLKII